MAEISNHCMHPTQTLIALDSRVQSNFLVAASMEITTHIQAKVFLQMQSMPLALSLCHFCPFNL